MPRAAAKSSAHLVLVCGEDEFAVKQRAKEVFLQWSQDIGSMDQEVIDGTVANSGEALKVIARVREALQSLPFFGSAKIIWLQNCNFLGDERAASAQAVTDSLGSLAQELKTFSWDNVHLLISAGKVDKRRAFYKTIDSVGNVETYAGWSIDDRDWAERAEFWAKKGFTERAKQASEAALSEIVTRVGPNARQLDNEVEKVCLYIGSRERVEVEDVEAICTRNKAARAFALGDALGDRDLRRLLRCLDEELWEVKLDPQKSEIGLLYGLIAKVRAMLLLKQMVQEGWVKTNSDYARFKDQLSRVPPERLPQDRRFNPLALNPYVLFKALGQVERYSQNELVKAMDLLLTCNQRLVSSGADQSLVLQQTLVQIVGNAESRPPATSRA